MMQFDFNKDRKTLRREIKRAVGDFNIATVLVVLSLVSLIGFFIKWFRDNRSQKRTALEDLKWQLENYFEDIDINANQEISTKYIRLLECYKELLTCDKIWDVTSSLEVDRKVTRSAASERITRSLVEPGLGRIDKIKTRYGALLFPKVGGGALYVYPAFVAVLNKGGNVEMIDIRELKISYSREYFVEGRNIPKDAVIVGKTWAKVNEDGSPDQRFNNNYEIPICQYGEIEFENSNGLNEVYSFSSSQKSEAFAAALQEYQEAVRTIV